MYKYVIGGLVLMACSTAAQADHDFHVGYQEMSFTNTASGLGAAGDQNSIQFLDQNYATGSGSLKSVFVQWDFSKYFGVVYSHGRASNVPLHIYGYNMATGSITGDTYSFEAHYPVLGWLEVLGRVNSANYDVSGDCVSPQYCSPSLPTQYQHESKSDSQTYPSAGLRAKFSSHFGGELIIHDFADIFTPSISFGLYVRF